MISRKNKLKSLNKVQQKYFKTSQKKFNQYQISSNDNIKTGSIKKLSKKSTNNKFKKGGRKITQNKSIFTKKSSDRIGGTRSNVTAVVNKAETPKGANLGQTGTQLDQGALPNSEPERAEAPAAKAPVAAAPAGAPAGAPTVATVDEAAASAGAPAAAPAGAPAPEATKGLEEEEYLSTSSSLSKGTELGKKGSSATTGEENIGSEDELGINGALASATTAGKPTGSEEESIGSEEQPIVSQKLVEKEINTSEISKRLTLIEQYLGIPLVKTGDGNGEAECQNVNLSSKYSDRYLQIPDEEDENSFLDDEKNLGKFKELEKKLTKIFSYLGGARKNYSSQIQFIKNPNQTTNNEEELNSYDWVPIENPENGQVPTNYNLLFQRLLLLSAIPLNRNEKLLLESLIKIYGDNNKLSKELLQLIGLNNKETLLQ